MICTSHTTTVGHDEPRPRTATGSGQSSPATAIPAMAPSCVFLHPADRHLERISHQTHLTDEQGYVFDQLADIAQAKKVHAVLVAGDPRESGRMAGIISHVLELKERIDVRLKITPSREGSSARFVRSEAA